MDSCRTVLNVTHWGTIIRLHSVNGLSSPCTPQPAEWHRSRPLARRGCETPSASAPPRWSGPPCRSVGGRFGSRRWGHSWGTVCIWAHMKTGHSDHTVCTLNHFFFSSFKVASGLKISSLFITPKAATQIGSDARCSCRASLRWRGNIVCSLLSLLPFPFALTHPEWWLF